MSASTVTTFGLHLEDAARDEHQLLLAAARGLDAHRAGLDAGDERRVPRIDAELARLAGKHDELGLAGADRLFGADDVDVDGGVRHGYLQRLRLLEGFLDRADHVERLLGQRVALAVRRSS